jgi:uroporphyrin-III C-methyltransferase
VNARIYHGTLETLAERLDSQGGPVVIVVGEVAAQARGAAVDLAQEAFARTA